jgi:hypothetical protein
MDRDRFRKRATELRDWVSIARTLSNAPDRATAKDFSSAADLMEKAARDLDDLLKATLPGCICRSIFYDDGGGYIDYEKDCRHHGSLYRQLEQNEAHYVKMERALKDEVRLRIVTSALTGTAISPHDNEDLVRWALAIADEVLEQIRRENA